jgi:hypothetical protein
VKIKYVLSFKLYIKAWTARVQRIACLNVKVTVNFPVTFCFLLIYLTRMHSIQKLRDVEWHMVR